MAEVPTISVRVSEDEKLQIEKKLVAERTKAQRLLYGWLMEWLAGNKKTAAASTSAQSSTNHESIYRTENRELHEKLEAILNSGDQRILDAVVPNIEVFYDRMRPAQRKRRGA
jgi:hypothetical protein